MKQLGLDHLIGQGLIFFELFQADSYPDDDFEIPHVSDDSGSSSDEESVNPRSRSSPEVPDDACVLPDQLYINFVKSGIITKKNQYAKYPIEHIDLHFLKVYLLLYQAIEFFI